MEKKAPDLEGYLALINGREGERFRRFRDLLAEYNGKFNLTSVTDGEEVLYKHFLDSAAGEFLFPVGASVAEVGSGAGFPSLPLKILREDLVFTLFESTEKKCGFLRIAAKELALEGVTVCNLRAEDAARREYREGFDVCCARAVARLNTLAEYCLPLVRPGGRFVAYKGGDASEEIAEAERAVALLGGGKLHRAEFSLPEDMGKRTLVWCEKVGNTPAKYPRGRGKERSAPIL